MGDRTIMERFFFFMQIAIDVTFPASITRLR